MTNQEAIKHLKIWADANEKASENPHVSELLKSEIAVDIEAMKLAIAAMERQEPMEPEKIDCDEGLTIRYFCPACKRYLGQRGKHSVILFDKETFCQNLCCGQKLNWKEGTE